LQRPGGVSTDAKPVVVFIKDSRESNQHQQQQIESDEDTAANERLHDVVGDIKNSFSSSPARRNSQYYGILRTRHW